MRIGMVLADRDRLPDIRIDKEAAALVEAGHEVHLLTAARAPAEPLSFTLCPARALPLSLAGLTPRPHPRRLVSMLRSPPSRAQLSRSLGLEGARFQLLGISRPWLREVERFVKQVRPQVLHAHDLLVLPTVLEVAQRARLPVVADLHENWPAYLAVEIAHQRRWGWSVRRWRRREAHNARRCAAVLVVAPEAGERLLAAGVPPHRLHVVSNTEPPAPEVGPLPQYQDRQVMLFAGSAGPERDLSWAVDALPQLRQHFPSLLYLVIGPSQQVRRGLQRRAESLSVKDAVEVVPWVSRDALQRYLASATLGLLPLLPSEHTHTMMPHKLFQYMAHGLPSVVSACGPAARVVRETGAGLLFEPGSVSSLVAAVERVLSDPGAREQMGAAGRAAVRGPYAWERDAERLRAVYQSLPV